MQMPADVTLVAFDVLIDFVDLYDYVKRDSKVIYIHSYGSTSDMVLTRI